MENKVLIVGGSGLVGQQLSTLLKSKGFDTYILSRKEARSDKNQFHWDPEKGEIDMECLTSPVIINLSGANIAEKSWNDARKKLLVESRVKSTEFLFQQLKINGHKPAIYIGASAIGYYGDRADEIMDENSPRGQGFLTNLCKSWEDAHKLFETIANRYFVLRIGIVLSTKGGALAKSITPLKLGIATFFGNGSQYVSWIHIQDLCRIILYNIENSELKSGVYNAVGPNPVDNKQYIRALRKVVNPFSILIPAPKAGLKLALGELASIVLDSIRVSSEKIENSGFQFEFPDLEKGLKDLVKNKV
jgi:uncharacterized protein (TIGR01777 family)